ncbi:hypothetical protein O181_103523 [Austropuccinia psidii MF-1]|uniref:Uncharacterized protein n=1 Tax=Austropuccinia psidii MF-1 TaxID=1389203 RepID=A0A9Q3PJ44_9BASI|nr:hypothetical protein [Austropuccinia psidii MF-1]
MSRLGLSPVYQSSTPSSGQIPTQFLGYNNFDQAFEHSSNPLVELGQDINMKSIAEASLLSQIITDLQSWSNLDRSQALDAMSHDGLQLTLSSYESLENGITPTIARNLRIDLELRQPDQITFIDSTALLNNQINQHNHEIFEKQDFVLETNHEKVTDVIGEMSIDSSTQQDHNELPLRKDLILDLLQINQLQTLAEMDQLDTLLEPRSPDPLPSPILAEQLLLTPTNSSTTTKTFPNYHIPSEV